MEWRSHRNKRNGRANGHAARVNRQESTVQLQCPAGLSSVGPINANLIRMLLPLFQHFHVLMWVRFSAVESNNTRPVFSWNRSESRPMATSESATITTSFEECRLEEVSPHQAEASALPETDEKENEKEIITEREFPDETPKQQQIGFSREPEILTTSEPEKGETLEATHEETPKEPENSKDHVPPDVADENIKHVVEEERPAESVDNKELQIAVPTVDQTRQNPTEEAPTTVVHQVQQSRATNIFHSVGSKMMQSVQKMKNAILGKPTK